MSLVALAMPALLGVMLLRALGLRWRDDLVACPAWAWLLGCLGLGACVQAALVLRVPPAWWWILPTLLVAGSALVAARRTAPVAAPAPRVGGGYAWFVLGGAAFCLLFVAAGMDRPCIEGDEGNIWSLKAKSLLVDWPAHFAAAQVHNLHPDYPQLNPLLQAWVHSLSGAPDFTHFDNRWLVQLCDVALFVAVAGALRRRLPALPAAALASLLLLEPEFQGLCRTAYADGMLALGLVVGVDAFLRWRDSGDRRFGWLAGLGLAFALWSKNETMLYLGCAGLAALLTRAWLLPLRGSWSLGNVRLFLPAALVIAFTTIWNACFGLKSDLLGSNPTGKSMFTLMAEQWQQRVPAMLAEGAGVVVSMSHAGVVFGLLLLGVVCAPRHALGRRLAMPVLALLGALLGIHVVYVGSFLPLRMHLDTSYTRVLFQLLPAALVLLAALASGVVGARRAGHTALRP